MTFEARPLCNLTRRTALWKSDIGLNNIYSVIINTIVNIYTMSCETGSDSKHKANI